MNARNGFSLVELMIVISIISILALIAIPNYTQRRQDAYNAAAEAFRVGLEKCEANYFLDHRVYAADVDDLLAYDRNLLDTPNITFIWVASNSSGYTFNIRAQGGSRWFTSSEP